MQKLSISIYITLIIAVVAIGLLIINDIAEKGKSFLNSIQNTENDPAVIISESNSGTQKDSLTYVIDDVPASETIAEPAIADTLITEH